MRNALRLARSHSLKVRASKSASSVEPIVATSFTHSCIVSGAVRADTRLDVRGVDAFK